MKSVQSALYVSVGLTLAALFLFGYIKGRVTGINALRSGLQITLIGGIGSGCSVCHRPPDRVEYNVEGTVLASCDNAHLAKEEANAFCSCPVGR